MKVPLPKPLSTLFGAAVALVIAATTPVEEIAAEEISAKAHSWTGGMIGSPKPQN